VDSGDAAAIEATVGRLTRWGLVDTVLILFTMTAMVLRWT
jgi:hypothetical protein